MDGELRAQLSAVLERVDDAIANGPEAQRSLLREIACYVQLAVDVLGESLSREA
jgi:hypothetical protein